MYDTGMAKRCDNIPGLLIICRTPWRIHDVSVDPLYGISTDASWTPHGPPSMDATLTFHSVPMDIPWALHCVSWSLCRPWTFWILSYDWDIMGFFMIVPLTAAFVDRPSPSMCCEYSCCGKEYWLSIYEYKTCFFFCNVAVSLVLDKQCGRDFRQYGLQTTVTCVVS